MRKRSAIVSGSDTAGQTSSLAVDNNSASHVSPGKLPLNSPASKHKFYFQFIINSLELLPERPTSVNLPTTPRKKSINAFFKQFAEGPKLPRVAQLEWKRNSRKRGKVPVCKFQKSIDPNKPDHYIFFTRDEKSFEFASRMATSGT